MEFCPFCVFQDVSPKTCLGTTLRRSPGEIGTPVVAPWQSSEDLSTWLLEGRSMYSIFQNHLQYINTAHMSQRLSAVKSTPDRINSRLYVLVGYCCFCQILKAENIKQPPKSHLLFPHCCLANLAKLRRKPCSWRMRLHQ